MLDRIANRIGDAILKVGRSGIDGPVFVKEFEDKEEDFAYLEQLKSNITDKSKKKRLETDIRLMRLGIQGERNVLFELQHSFIPMLCLHDVRITYEGLSAQMDFIVITRHNILILEAKKLVGDITVTADGNFNRIFKGRNGRVYKKEGMYNPISQGARQARLLAKYLKSKGIIKHTPVLPFAILANSKNVVNTKGAPKDTRKRLWKYDMITKNIQSLIDENDNGVNLSDKRMYEIAELILQRHRPKDYIEVYAQKYDVVSVHEADNSAVIPDKSLKDALTEYRLDVSRKEEIRAYFIFTNKELEEILIVKPRTLDQLSGIKGFGKVKVEKYGEQIIEIVKRYE